MIELRAVRKAYGDCRVLEGVDFDVRPGECVALCGENGAGKSTLLRILMGLDAADSGTVRVAAGMGMVHQHFSLVPALTVAENVWLGDEPLRFGLFDAARARAETRRLANDIGWQVAPDARVETLTVGERQRVEVLKALRTGRQVLLLDEPTATLTHTEVPSFLEVIRGVAARGTAVVFVSHKLAEVAALCARAVVLRKGVVVGQFAATAQEEIAAAMIGSGVASAPRDPAGSQAPRLARVRAVALKSRELKAATFTVHAGDVLGIAGVDGNGQEALFHVLAGIAPVEGELTTLTREQGLRVVPADKHRDALLMGRSVADNLLLGHRDVDADALRTWDVRPPDLRKDVAELSGGNQQKLLFAREMRGVQLLLLHEPTRGVDWYAREMIWRGIKQATGAGAACIVISSDYDELKTICTHLAVLYRGVLTTPKPIADVSDTDVGRAMGGLS